MAKIKSLTPFDGAERKTQRLGLQPLVGEVIALVKSTRILLDETPMANSAAAVRQLLDSTFLATGSWVPKKSGDVDWSKCKVVNGTRVCVGVEIQVSARSELLYKDILHLKTRIARGDIDVGLIVVPSDRLQTFLPDRTPSASYAKRVIAEQDADRLPIVLVEMEHDGPGPVLVKQITNLSKRAPRRSKKQAAE